MNFNVIPTERFRKEVKRLIKKYPSLKSDLLALNKQLLINPRLGTALGNSCYKIRLAIKSKGQGKSGGGRVITYFISEEKSIYLLTIYDKSEFGAIDDQTLKYIITSIKRKN